MDRRVMMSEFLHVFVEFGVLTNMCRFGKLFQDF